MGIALATGTRPWREGGGTGVIALVSGAVDAAANVCYVLAIRAGLFGLAGHSGTVGTMNSIE